MTRAAAAALQACLVTCLLLRAAVLLAQAPAQRGTRAPATAPRDTIYVAIPGPPPEITVQTPPPRVTVESSSNLPTIILGILGAVLLGVQLLIMRTQSELLAKQTALGEQQSVSRRDEAIGTFYRIAHDIADEFKKANQMAGAQIPANFDTHPRQMLREAARLFAPLGNPFVFAATATAMYLDRYFEAVQAYNQAPGGESGMERWFRVKRLRRQVGNNLDATAMTLPPEQRWKPREATDYRFGDLCGMPASLSEALTGDPGDSDEAEEVPGDQPTVPHTH